MSDTELDFKKDFIAKYSLAEYESVERLINNALEERNEGIDGLWSLWLDIEKIHSLQFTYYLHLSKPTNSDDEEVNLVFENGINAGTVLSKYCLEGGGLGKDIKLHEELVDIKPDWSRIDPKISKRVVYDYLKANKAKILEMYRRQSYDNYVTGGGTTKTKSHYKNEIQKFYDGGFYWELVYETIEVDRCFV